MDLISKEHRSWNMGRIKSQDTIPEIIVRKLLFSLGFRFRLHSKKLPGKPDIVLPKYKVVIMVHGCFWHCHDQCIDSRLPKTRTDFWEKKLSANVERDKRNYNDLTQLGWKVITVWECEIKSTSILISKLNNIRSASNNPDQMHDRQLTNPTRP